MTMMNSKEAVRTQEELGKMLENGLDPDLFALYRDQVAKETSSRYSRVRKGHYLERDTNRYAYYKFIELAGTEGASSTVIKRFALDFTGKSRANLTPELNRMAEEGFLRVEKIYNMNYYYAVPEEEWKKEKEPIVKES